MCRCVLVCGYTAALWGQRHLIPSEPFLPLVPRPLLRDWIVTSLETRISLRLLCSLGYLKLPVIACFSFWVLGQQVWATALLLTPLWKASISVCVHCKMAGTNAAVSNFPKLFCPQFLPQPRSNRETQLRRFLSFFFSFPFSFLF